MKKAAETSLNFVWPTLSGLLVRFYEREQDFRGEGVFLFRARVVFKCLQAARALLFSRLSLYTNFYLNFAGAREPTE